MRTFYQTGDDNKIIEEEEVPEQEEVIKVEPTPSPTPTILPFKFLYTTPTPPPYDAHGNSFATAFNIGKIFGKTVLDGGIEVDSDFDYIRFAISEGGLYSIRTEGEVDTVGQLFDLNKNSISPLIDDVKYNKNFSIEQVFNSGQIAYLKLYAYNSEKGNFSIIFERIMPTPTPTTTPSPKPTLNPLS